MKIIVVVVTYNAMRWAERCFSSIRNSNMPLDCIVIDNMSSDSTVDYIKTNFPEIILVQPDENLGFGKGNNLGLQYAIDHNYDYVYLLNQDAWLYPDTIEQLLSVHEKYGDIGILSPMQIQANEFFLDENFADGTCRYSSNKDIINDLYFKRDKDYYEVPFVMAAHWLISKACLLSVGGFSPVFLQYGEDGNYAARTRSKGFKIVIVPGARAVHDRENRQMSKKQLIYLSYVGCLSELSGFYVSSKHHHIWCLMLTIHTCIKYFSFHPIKNYIRIICNLRFINKCRKESFGNCAFLRNNSYYTENNIL